MSTSPRITKIELPFYDPPFLVLEILDPTLQPKITTMGVTSRQGMLTPPRHLTLPLVNHERGQAGTYESQVFQPL
jgi:hypothetical protein